MDRNVQALLAILTARPFPVASPPEGTGSVSDLWSAEKQQAALALVWRDLMSKVPDIGKMLLAGDRQAQSEGAALAKAGGLVETAAPTDPEGTVGSPTIGDRAVDVLVTCLRPTELVPILLAFEIDPTKTEDVNLAGQKIYYKEIERDRLNPLRVAIAAVDLRKLAIAVVVGNLVSRFRPKAVLLCGSSRGVEETTRLGDVVVTRTFIDAAGEDARGDEHEAEWVDVALSDNTDLQLSYFMSQSFDRKKWRQEIEGGLSKLEALNQHAMPPERALREARFLVTFGDVIARDELPGMRPLSGSVRSTDTVLSCESRASGFGRACNGRSLDWALFQGIAHHADHGEAERWLGTASFNAGMAARWFLSTQFRLPTEIQPFHF